jgi:hypothetical protein
MFDCQTKNRRAESKESLLTKVEPPFWGVPVLDGLEIGLKSLLSGERGKPLTRVDPPFGGVPVLDGLEIGLKSLFDTRSF